ncbi:hypothetical protein BVX94_00830 [bacterium B17]|nr:hypothetical protein BVX94_00830 [bacterium B17]
MNKIFFNSSLLLLARALQMIASFIVMMVLLPRYLTLVDFGRYSAIVVSVGAVMTISFFGIGKLLIRDIARNKENAADLTGMALTVRTLLLILASTVTALIMWIKGVPDIHTGMAIAFVVLFFISRLLLEIRFITVFFMHHSS